MWSVKDKIGTEASFLTLFFRKKCAAQMPLLTAILGDSFFAQNKKEKKHN